MQKLIYMVCCLFVFVGCANYDYPSQVTVGELMPAAVGQSLEEETVNIPEDFAGQQTLLLLGYKQDSQFDIDRWLIGLDMTNTQVAAYEIPSIQGMFPRMFSTLINNGMRKGIPKDLWKGVVTVYEDGDKLQRFTGNQNPNNARVILLDPQGHIVYFYDAGFAVSALKALKGKINE